MSDYIPLSVPSLKGNEWKYLKECIDTEWVSSVGKYVSKFEDDICKYTGAKHAVACVNGTAALHTAFILAGVRAGDEVIVPTLTFIASINPIRYIGAQPIFMDSDDYYNIDVDKLIDFIKRETEFRNDGTYNKRTGRKITAIVPVHVFGNAVMFEPIVEMLRERKIKIIEDATESLGTRYTEGIYSGKHTGTIGDIGCISFNGNKIITTGGGGMVITDDIELAERARYLTTQAKDDEVYYVHNDIGFNYRLTNIQAALGVAQLEQLPEFLNIKKRNYDRYKSRLKSIDGLSLADSPYYADNNHWMYPLKVDATVYSRTRDELISDLMKKRIQTRPVWHLNHLQKPYEKCYCYNIDNASSLLEKTVNLPCSVNLTEDNIYTVIEALKYS
jgi:perosamine synthetase